MVHCRRVNNFCTWPSPQNVPHASSPQALSLCLNENHSTVVKLDVLGPIILSKNPSQGEEL